MENIRHEIELYPIEDFKIILDYELRRSRRYKFPLTLIHIAMESEPGTPEAQHAAELVAINALDISLRDSDIPCRDGHEFLVLLPSTNERGGRSACERLEMLLNASGQTRDGTPFGASAFIGISSTSGDVAIPAAKLMDQASAAMNDARTKRSRKTITFSEME